MPSLLETATELPALLAATRRAALSKRQQPEVAAFLMDAERECLRLQRALRAPLASPLAWRPGPARTFCIRGPKPRQITQLPFADRVVHHALCAVVDPLLERYAIFDSYACRRGKGQHAALRRAQRFVAAQPGGWAFKGDVAAYFASIPHDPLLALLSRRVGDPDILRVLERILRAYPHSPGRGLPIGALTSQHLANLYLGALDHHIKDDLGYRYYLRYMDDFVALGDRPSMVALRQCAEEFLRDKLLLCLNPRSSHLRPVRDGVPFLGMRIYAAVIRPQAASWRRFRNRLRIVQTALSTGQITEEEAAKRLASQYAHAAHFNTYRLRTQDLARAAEAGAASGLGADDRRREPRDPGGLLRQRGGQRAGREPQQEPALEPQPEHRFSSCELSTASDGPSGVRTSPAGLVRGAAAPGLRIAAPVPRC